MRATRWLGGVVGAVAAAAIVVSCGGTGGGGGNKGNPSQQFVLNSNNSGRLTLNISPSEVDANKSDRIGLTAQLTDSTGRGVQGVVITFTSDVDDVNATTPGDLSFIPNQVAPNGQNFGQAVTNANGVADIIAVAGSDPTGTGEIVGFGAFFAEPPSPFGLRAQVPVTLYDVGFIDTVDGLLNVLPTSLEVVEPGPGAVLFFNIVGGTPPYLLKNEVSGIGAATISQHCLPGCTENGGVLCVGSPCQEDGDCNLNGSSTPAGVCVGPIQRCVASCAGTNCAGSRCDTDADCNDGSPTPANVCKDSGQSIAYIISADPPSGTHGFLVEDSIGGAVNVEVTVSFVCGNGVARGEEQCDLGDLRGATCEALGRPAGALTCTTDCTFDTAGCTGTGGSPGAPTATPGGGATPTGVTPTPTPALTATPASTATPGIGAPTNLVLALLTNGAGDNGNGTFTTVIAATVTDSNGNPVASNTNVFFSISGPTQGAGVSSPSGTNSDPPCDVTNFEADTGQSVLNQLVVAHTCITYPSSSVGQPITLNAVSGVANDSDSFNLPNLPP